MDPGQKRSASLKHSGFEAWAADQQEAFIIGFSGQLTLCQPIKNLRILGPSNFYVACGLFISHWTESEGLVEFYFGAEKSGFQCDLGLVLGGMKGGGFSEGM